ncbi:hypothetical protein [Vulcanisaeta thermophila]|uniref:hypothetical protein n=1 Tax=Vulcanisaeta thermophila TaxID=867917 RepID=UPI0008529821|nr:hypothetical protein [Vulcanisaeta thermophila]
MRRRGGQGRLLSEDRELNWNIKLIEVSVKLQSKSRAVIKEALRLYGEGVITRDEALSIIRLSGARLGKVENPRRFEGYVGEEVVDNVEEVVGDEYDVPSDYEVVEEEYLGQRVLRRVLGDV